MNFINVTEEMDALNIIGQKYDIKDNLLFAIYIYQILKYKYMHTSYEVIYTART